MSIATEQKVEQLLKRVDDLEGELNETRQRVQKLEEQMKDVHGARANKR